MSFWDTHTRKEKLTVLLTLIGIIIAGLTFYFQFIFINSSLYITPLKPTDLDQNGITYIYLLNNPGNSVISISKLEYKYVNEKDKTKNIVLNYLENGKIETMEPNTTKKIFKKLDGYDMVKDENGSHYFDFSFIDGKGVLKSISMPLCLLPIESKHNIVGDYYSLEFKILRNVINPCDKSVQIY